MASNDFLSNAPKFITTRFNSINKYVWQTLVPERTLKDRIRKFKTKVDRKSEIRRLKTISNEASTIVFLFLLNKFFVEGANAAKQAVDIFRELNVQGFYIGSNYFSGRNENVTQGDRISERLLSSIQDQKVKDLVIKSKYISEIIDEYKKVI